MNSKILILASVASLLIFGLFFGSHSKKASTPIKQVKPIQSIEKITAIVETIPVPPIAPIAPVQKIAPITLIAPIAPIKIIKKHINNISDKQNPFFDPDDESIKYPPIIKLPNSIKKKQSPFKDPDEEELSDYERQYRRIADLQTRVENYTKNMVEYSIDQIPEEAKEGAVDIFGFFHETITDIFDVTPTSKTNEDEEYYIGY